MPGAAPNPTPASAPAPEPGDRAQHWLDLAARLAVRAFGHAEPNPLVGAVIVKDGQPIGLGHHRRFGGAHAEREAIRNAEARGHDPRGATLYVTLEPCNHHGKQPPCAELLIESGLARVVYARPDPGEDSSGGAQALRAAGIAAELSTASPFAARLSEPFIHRVRTGRPWVIAKWAQTLDGRVATRTGHSQWISGERSRARVHRLRARVDGILTGIGTVLADDPRLNARTPRPPRRAAARIVVDADLDLPPTSQLAQTARGHRTIVCCAEELTEAAITADRRRALIDHGVEILGVPTDFARPGRLRLEAMLERLAGRGLATVMTEAGPSLVGSLLEADLADDALVYLAPLVLGDELAMAAATGRVAETLRSGRAFELLRHKVIGGDVELWYRRHRG